ncbi:MAG: amidohydrolase [Streptosporangiaceae bacterium]
MAEGPATVLTAGKIRPDYHSGASFRHIVIVNGAVKALSNTREEASRAAGPTACWVDLGSACAGPGFIDTHVHAIQAAADARLVSLREVTTVAALLAAVRAAALRRSPDEWTVSARNWHESQLREGRLPTRKELDALGVPGPILLRRGSHLAVLNSRAWAVLAKHGEAMAAGAGPTVTGGVSDAPGAAPVTSDTLIARAVQLAGARGLTGRCDDLATVLARFNARGITSIREAGVDAGELELFQALRADGRLSLRCDLLWRVPEGSDVGAARQRIQGMPADDLADPYLRLTGVKIFVDGRIADAAVSCRAGPDYGCAEPFRVTRSDLWLMVRESLAQGSGVGCHAVGDQAVRMVLDVYERALATGLARDPGQLIVEHALNCTPETIRRLAVSRVGVSAHPGIVYEFADEMRRYWGAENSAAAAPVRDMVSAGVQVAAGSDGDVPPFDPMRNIWFMVTRMDRTGGLIGPDQAMARSLAFDLYTRRGAALLGVAGRRGGLWPGMDADLVAFAADPLSCPARALPDTEVVLTLLAGRPVYDPAGLMARASS